MTEAELLDCLEKKVQDEFCWMVFKAAPIADAPVLYRFVLQVRIQGDKAVQEQLLGFADKLNTCYTMRYYACQFRPEEGVFSVICTASAVPAKLITPTQLMRRMKRILTPAPDKNKLTKSADALFSVKKVNNTHQPDLKETRRKTT